MSGLDYSDRLKGGKILLHVYEAEMKWRESNVFKLKGQLSKPSTSRFESRSDSGLVTLTKPRTFTVSDSLLNQAMNQQDNHISLQEIQIINRQRAGDIMFKMIFPLNKILDVGTQTQSLTASRKCKNLQNPYISRR